MGTELICFKNFSCRVQINLSGIKIIRVSRAFEIFVMFGTSSFRKSVRPVIFKIHRSHEYELGSPDKKNDVELATDETDAILKSQ